MAPETAFTPVPTSTLSNYNAVFDTGFTPLRTQLLKVCARPRSPPSACRYVRTAPDANLWCSAETRVALRCARVPPRRGVLGMWAQVCAWEGGKKVGYTADRGFKQTPQLPAGAICMSNRVIRCKYGGGLHDDRFHRICIHKFHLCVVKAGSGVLLTNPLMREFILEQKHEYNLPMICFYKSMQDAESARCIPISGMELFLGQAVAQFRLFAPARRHHSLSWPTKPCSSSWRISRCRKSRCGGDGGAVFHGTVTRQTSCSVQCHGGVKDHATRPVRVARRLQAQGCSVHGDRQL